MIVWYALCIFAYVFRYQAIFMTLLELQQEKMLFSFADMLFTPPPLVLTLPRNHHFNQQVTLEPRCFEKAYPLFKQQRDKRVAII